MVDIFSRTRSTCQFRSTATRDSLYTHRLQPGTFASAPLSTVDVGRAGVVPMCSPADSTMTDRGRFLLGLWEVSRGMRDYSLQDHTVRVYALAGQRLMVS